MTIQATDAAISTLPEWAQAKIRNQAEALRVHLLRADTAERTVRNLDAELRKARIKIRQLESGK